MKKRLILATCFITSGLATAAVPIDGWYTSVSGGLAYLPDHLSITSSNPLRTHAEYLDGYNAGGSLGFKSTPLRYEAEFTYLSARLERFRISGLSQTGVSGYNHTGLAIANIYYDLPAVIRTIEPFFGLGFGYGYIKDTFVSTGPSGLTSNSASDSVFAYQATAGLTYNFAETWALNLGYRYIATDKSDQFGKMLQAHLANIGVIYRFDGSLYQ